MALAAKLLAWGTGWSVSDFVCTSGPRDPCYVEQHRAYSIALVTEANFQYRTAQGSALMTPGSLLLGNEGACLGVTPGQYMLSMRLRRAAVRLRRSNDAIATVALDCGFDDLSTFNRQFRRATGLPPGAYRAQRVPSR
jgi:hypothetical protein